MAEKSGNDFHIVVYHMGSALDYAFQGIPIATQVRNKHFHPASRHFLIKPFYAPGKYPCPSVGEVIPRDRSDNDIPESQLFDRLGETFRFHLIQSFGRPVPDIAVEAVSRTDIPEN
jgi:hypothetical protein